MTDDDDRQMLAELQAMWQRRDPAPDGLVSSVILALATADLDDEYEVLTLMEATDRLAGVRGASDTRTLTFGTGPVMVMLRVSVLAEGRRRLDGWVSPPSPWAVTLRLDGEEVGTTSTVQGRFELADVPAGTGVLRLRARPEVGANTEPATPDAKPERVTAAVLRLETPTFTL